MFYRTVAFGLCLGILSCGLEASVETDVDRLITALHDEDDAVRVTAMERLGRLGPKAVPAMPTLQVLLREDSPAVRAYAARTLGRIGEAAQPAVPELIRAFGDLEPAVRRTAVEAVGHIRPDAEAAVGPFVRLMEDSNPAVRLRALHTLAEYGEAAVPALLELLEKDRAAYWACLVLNQIGPDATDAVPALTERVSDERAEVRREAILALAEIGEAAAPAADEIAAALEDGMDRIPATYALGRIGRIPPEAEARIRKNADSPDPLLRAVSVWSLARAYPEDRPLQQKATEELVAVLESEDPHTRAAAAKALGALEPDPEMAAPILEEALDDADEETVRDVLDALAGMGAAMVPQLTRALRFEPLRPRIAFLLGEMGPEAEPAIEALIELIDGPCRRTQHEALIALGKIGPAAEAAVPALTEALRHTDGPCRYGAVYALGRIGPEAEPAKPILLETTESSDATLALLSAWALAQIAPECPQCAEKNVPLLIDALEHPDPRHRVEAAAALGAMGSLAESAVPALQEAAEDIDIGVRTAATAAVEAIEP